LNVVVLAVDVAVVTLSVTTFGLLVVLAGSTGKSGKGTSPKEGTPASEKGNEDENVDEVPVGGPTFFWRRRGRLLLVAHQTDSLLYKYYMSPYRLDDDEQGPCLCESRYY
jgi:hypothetical protein